MNEIELYEFTVANDRSKIIAKKIDLNINYQILVIFIGLMSLFHPQFLDGTEISFFKFNSSLASIMIPFLLVYFFTRFGYLLWNYHGIRKIIDKKINGIDGSINLQIQDRYVIFGQSSIAEIIYMWLKKSDDQKHEFKEDNNFPTFKLPFFYMIIYIISFVLSLNHSLVFYFGMNLSERIEAFPLYLTFIFMTFFLITTIGCYRDYILMAENRNFLILSAMNFINSMLILAYLVYRN